MRTLALFLAIAVLVVSSTAFAQQKATQSNPSQHDKAVRTADAPPPQKAPAREGAIQGAESIPQLELAAVAVCNDVQDREPIGAGEVFASDVGTLMCFTDVRNGVDPTEIYHRWYINDQMINEIVINVRGPRWRCWSEKTILPSWKGDCRVEIVTEEGEVIGTAEFELGDASAPKKTRQAPAEMHQKSESSG